MSPPRARSILLMASLAACSRPGRIEAGREADAAAADAPAPVPDVLPRDLGPPDFPPDGAEIAPAPFACKLPPTTTGGRCNLCGDGRIEECSGLLYGAAAVAQASDPPRPPPPNEFCDGAPQPGATCASLGFLGGELRCADSCVNHDTSGCTICGSDPALRGCRASVVPEGNRPIGALALAATETQIALAWSVFDAGGADYGVGIRRFHPDLSPIDETSCVRFKLTGGLNLALVPTPAGFLLASEQYTSARLTPLGPDGALRGPGRELTQAWAPRLASRPEGGQAVAWFDRVRKDVAFVGVIDVEGREVAPPIQFPADVMAGELSLLAVSDGFLAASIEPGQGVFLLKVGLDGKALGQAVVAGARAPRLVGEGNEPQLLHVLAGARVVVPLDGRGAPISASAVTLAAGEPLGGSAPAVLAWKSEILELGEVPVPALQTVNLALAHRRPMGAPGVPSIRITQQPADSRVVRLGRRGDEVIAAWMSIEELPGAMRTQTWRIGLARLVP